MSVNSVEMMTCTPVAFADLFPFWFCLFAELVGIVASRAEVASGRRVHRAWDIALKDYSL